MARVRVDYSRWLRSPVVEIALAARERAALRVGDVVVVEAEDGITERNARVVAIIGARVRLELLEAVTNPGVA